ncbi:MAG: hypothetical protein VB095_13935 [Anaerovorax sp.]|nr:hypothetical protein [Anaerovorax sp.]
MNKYWKHKAKIVFGIGIPLGILILIIQETFHIPKNVMLHGYIIGSIVVIFLAFVINCIWQFRFQRRLKKMQTMLYQENELDHYIIQTDELLKKVKSNLNRNQLIINLSVAYCEKKQYEKAKEILLTIDENTLSGICKVIFYHDLAYYYFMLDERQEALQIIQKHQKMFAKFEAHPSLGPCIKINYIYKFIYEENWAKAKELLLELRDIQQDEMLKRSFQLAKQRFEQLTQKPIS